MIDPKEDRVHQDMTKPLCQYWINSSHNTYIAGLQVFGKPEYEAYAVVLRKGVRCIEIDCYDGRNGTPEVYHGLKWVCMQMGKLKLELVLEKIAQHAFETSPYPVIISLENHCTKKQQKVMVDLFKKKFGGRLLTKPVHAKETALPSPEDLKYKS